MVKKSEWWTRYREYLKSPEWKSRRVDVLRRDGYICQACLTNPATQVHHMSYKYGEHTPAFLLQSACDDCHETLTAIDRGEQAAWDWQGVTAPALVPGKEAR